MITTLALAVAASFHLAQTPKGFSDCAVPAELPLARGELLKVNCDLAIALNKDAYDRLVDQRLQIKELRDSWDKLKSSYDELQKQQLQLISELKGIDRTQDRYYEALKLKYGDVDKLAVESVENTRDALKLAKGARLSSYLTAGLLGGLGGGVAGSQVGGRGALEIGAGAGLGVLVGVGINWALLHWMGVQ